MEVLDILTETYPRLPTKLARAAKYALDHPDQVAITSMRGMAARCGVTPPTLLRLAHKAGFDSYDDFKTEFQRLVIPQSFRSKADALQEAEAAGGSAEVVDGIAAAAISNINDLFGGLDLDDLTRIADRLIAAPTVYVIGIGAMHWVATYLQSTGGMALPHLKVPQTGGTPLIEAIGALDKDDAVLVFTFAPYSRMTLEAVKFAALQGASVISVTDSRSSPSIEYSQDYILASTASPHFFPSITAVIAAVEAIMAVVVSRSDKAAIERIENIEDLRRRSGDYL